MSKKANDALRAQYVKQLSDMLTNNGEEVLQVAANELAIPVVDGEGNDNYVVFVVKVPTGSRDGDIYDAYERAQEYAMKCEEKKEKAAEDAKKKAAKIARDKAARERKQASKEKGEG